MDKELLNRIIEHFGMEHQRLKCVEELNELSQAICKLNERTNKALAIKHIIEEIADVEIMLAQLRLMLNLSEEDIEEMKEHKLDRTRQLYRI